MRRHKIGGFAAVMAVHVLDGAASIDLAHIGLLSGRSALRVEGVLLVLQRKLHHLGMGSGEQLAQLRFHDAVIALAEDAHHDFALWVDEEAVRPALRVVSLPGRTLFVGQYRPREAEALRRSANVAYVEANVELTVVSADYFESIRVIFAVPAFDHGEVANTVDAGVLPEIHEHDLAAVVGDMVRGASFIEPNTSGAKIGRGPDGGVDFGAAGERYAGHQQRQRQQMACAPHRPYQNRRKLDGH